MADFNPETRLIVEAAKEAGKIGMKYFRDSNTEVWYKQGNSPVSEADKAIDAYLKQELLNNAPDHGWLSEETEDNRERLDAERIFIVDPIDGTRGFIAGDNQWCISVAIVQGDRPVEGVLHCPALGRTLYAASDQGLFVNGKPVGKPENRKTPIVTGSKKLIELMRDIDGFGADVSDFIPSLAYRLGLVATRELDGAFARAGACEWDVAAADIILEEAGGKLMNSTGQALVYNKAQTRSPALVATHASRRKEIFALANSHGILQ